MARNRNTNSRGGGFSDLERKNVWKKGKVIPDSDSREWRRDALGHIIKWSEYGNTASRFGWEIDHIRPVSSGGTDDPANLQPLQWEANRDKADTWPWPCVSVDSYASVYRGVE